MSTLISLLVFVLIAGLIYYIIQLFPIPQPFKNIVLAIFLLVLLLQLLHMLGFYGGPVFVGLR